DYLERLAGYQEEGEGDLPEWQEWNTPVLNETVIQATAKVALLQPSADSRFDYWLRFSTLDRGQPVLLPVLLATYHRQVLAGKSLEASTTLARKQDGWWLTLSSEEAVSIQTPHDAPVIGGDVGIAHVLTTSDGKRYGRCTGTLAARHKRDRAKR